MLEISFEKNGKTFVFRAKTLPKLMGVIYAAGQGPNATIDFTDAIILTDRADVMFGDGDPALFSWTEDLQKNPNPPI